MTFQWLAVKQQRPAGGQSCACPHLLFPGCFTRPPGTSTRNHPHESDHVEASRPRGIMFDYEYSPCPESSGVHVPPKKLIRAAGNANRAATLNY